MTCWIQCTSFGPNFLPSQMVYLLIMNLMNLNTLASSHSQMEIQMRQPQMIVNLSHRAKQGNAWPCHLLLPISFSMIVLLKKWSLLSRRYLFCFLCSLCEISNNPSFLSPSSQILVQYSENSSSNQYTGGSRGIASPCRFFLNGSCNRGNRCPFSHSLPVTEVKGPACKFFFSLQVCFSLSVSIAFKAFNSSLWCHDYNCKTWYYCGFFENAVPFSFLRCNPYPCLLLIRVLILQK